MVFRENNVTQPAYGYHQVYSKKLFFLITKVKIVEYSNQKGLFIPFVCVILL
jgi:hypothetical protein